MVGATGLVATEKKTQRSLTLISASNTRRLFGRTSTPQQRRWPDIRYALRAARHRPIQNRDAKNLCVGGLGHRKQ